MSVPSCMILLLRHPRTPFVLACLAGGGLFGMAVWLGDALNLAACPLCILQRMANLALAIFAGGGLLLARNAFARRCAAFLMLASTLAGGFVAAYQSYIQRAATDIQCSGEAAWWELFVDWAGQQSPLLFMANGLCSDPAWKLFGLSLAEYSLLAFIALACISAWALLRRD